MSCRDIACIAAVCLATSAAEARIAENKVIDAADARIITDTCVALAAKSGWKVHVAVLNNVIEHLNPLGDPDELVAGDPVVREFVCTRGL